MWIRLPLPLLALLGIAVFLYPIAKQIRALASTADHWVLLAVAFLGMSLFLQRIHQFQWRFSRRPLTLYSFLRLLFSLAIAVVAIWWNLDGVTVAAGCFYFATLIASGLSKSEWEIARPYGSLLLLLASPIDVASSPFLNSYKQFALRCTSALLDAFQIRNVIAGDRIESFESWVDWSIVATVFWSNSALLAIVAFTIVWQHLRLIHGIFMLPLTVAIGMLMIIGRAAVIVAFDSANWLMLISYMSFAIAAYLTWVCLCVVRLVFDPIRGKHKSLFVPWWNRRTDAGLSLLRLRIERTVMDSKNADSCRLPTIESIKQQSTKRRPWLRRIASAFRRGFVQSFIFINDWCITRRYRRLLPLLPIVLVGVACCMRPNLRLQYAWSENELSEQYAIEVGAALDRGDRSMMELLTRRLMQFSTVSAPSRFTLAMALLAIDEGLDADAILTTLADDPINPYAPAKLGMAKRLLATPAQVSGSDQRRVQNYLREASLDPLLASEANWLLGRIYLQVGDDESALIRFRSIARPLPETSVLLALIYNRRGDSTAYLRCLRSAEIACKERLLNPDEFSPQTRFLLTRTLQLQDRFSEAMKVLEESPGFANDPATRQAAIMLDIAWLDSLPLDRKLERQERIQHATKLDATNPVLQKTLVAIDVSETNEGVQAFRQSEISESHNEAITEVSPGASRPILGTDAAKMGKFETAEREFRQAISAGYESPLMLNNLAWLLARKSDPVATEEAFVLVNRALKMSPRLAELWKTRAEIWQQKGCDLDAIADLEKAIQFGDQSPDVRLTLSELYDRQGDPGTAQRYRNEVAKKSPRQK